jgi:protocatechuate 3,4-dioxygenase beta subunit
MNHLIWIGILLTTLTPPVKTSLQAGDGDITRKERVVGLPCEGCPDVFLGIPDSLPSLSRIAPASEPGEPMRIEGTAFRINGTTAPGVVVYAYHTDARGVYPEDVRPGGKPGSRHGRIRGWVRTDADGRYRFDTIRPAGYPGTRAPQHVHMHIIEPGRCTYYIDDILFEDDPRLSKEQAQQMSRGRGGSGLVKPARDSSGVWVVTRDIRLGKNIPGYEECGKKLPSQQ